jgi:hypothetical protein
VFTPVLAKHSKSFSLIDCISVDVDRMQRSFEPMRKQVEAWQRSEMTDLTAKVVIYEAFVEGKLEAPKHLARTVHDLYFEPKYEEFRPPDDLESLECLHLRFQAARPDSSIQSYGEIGRVSGDSFLPVVPKGCVSVPAGLLVISLLIRTFQQFERELADHLWFL